MNLYKEKVYQLAKTIVSLVFIFFLQLGFLKAQSVSFSVPDGGERYVSGQTVRFQWNRMTANSCLKLYRNGNFYKQLYKGVDLGQYDWTISGVRDNNSDYYELYLVELKLQPIEGTEFDVLRDPIDGEEELVEGDILGISERFYINKGKLKLKSPNGGSSIPGNKNITFQWQDNLSRGKFEFHYRDLGGAEWHFIKRVSNNKNSTSWELPNKLMGNIDIRIRNTAYPWLKDQVNNVQVEKFIDVRKPNGGEEYQAGKTIQISASTNLYGFFGIELDRNGRTIRRIADKLDERSLRSFSWDIDPNINSNPGDVFQIEVFNLERVYESNSLSEDEPGTMDLDEGENEYEYRRGDISDRSEKFYIRSLELGFKNNLRGKEFLHGKDIEIEWEDNLQKGSFTLQYLRDGNWVTIVDSLSHSRNNYTWHTPSYEGKTRVRLFHSNFPNATIETGRFDLVKTINVLKPNADAIVKKEKSYQIKWETNVESDVKIELLNDNNSILDTLAMSVPPRNGTGNIGSKFWYVSEGYGGDIEPGYYKVKVSTPPIIPPPLPPLDNEVMDIGEGEDDYIPPPVGDKVVGISESFYVDFANYVDLVYPVSRLRPGDIWNIRWSTNIELVDIELVGENQVIPITENYECNISDPNQNQYNEFTWEIPSNLSDGTYRLRFKGDGTTIISSDVTIEAKSITISKPTLGEYWDPKAPHFIYWQDNLWGDVGIDLYQNDVFVKNLENSTESDGKYKLRSLRGITEGDNYKIVIYDTQDPDFKVSSDSFSILNFESSGDFTLNYVKSQTAKAPVKTETQLKNLPEEDVNTSVTYADGMGKTRQSISVGTSPNRNDVVNFNRYNTIGQEDTTWQSFTVSSRKGRLHLGAVDRQEKFYKQGQGRVPKNEAPYATAEYERSPILRVKEQGSVGKKWQPNPGSEDDHTVKMDYGTNKPNEVLRWKVDANGNPETSGYYSGSQLKVNRVVDENGAVSFTYKDKVGNEILKLGYKDDNTPVKTYYVYDKYSNLKFIVPPEAAKRLAGNVSTTFEKDDSIRKTWFTEFKYDAYDRMVWKKIPEADPVYTIYDPMGRVILTQDGNQRDKDQWFFTKYDIHGRTIMTGLYTESDKSLQTRKQMQTHVNDIKSYVYYEQRSAFNFDKQHGYTFNAFPNALDQCDIWTVSWYDDYDFNRDGQPDYEFEPRDKFTEIINSDGRVVKHVPSERTFDKATGELTRVLKRETSEQGTGTVAYSESPPATSREVFIKYDRVELKPGFRTLPDQRVVIGPDIKIPEDLSSEPSSSEPKIASPQTVQTGLSSEALAKEGSFDDAAKFLERATFYDKYGNSIYSTGENNLNGNDETWNLYDFSGKVLRTVSQHSSSVLSDPITIRKRFEYDHGDRLIRVWQQNNDDPEVLIAQNEYNELEQLTRKSLHSDNEGGIFLQNVDYKWHQRGWLKSVNNPKDLKKAGEYKDLFAFDLFYEQLPKDLNVKEQFNGNITGTRWKTADDANISGYSYRYDDLNQIKEALYGTSTNGSDWSNTAGRFNTSYDYDLNGNMQWAKRRGKSSLIDDLSYYYKGNLLAGVDDAVSDTTGMHFADFGSKFAPDSPEYYYDLNGNMIVDLNKGFEVLYNEMNLPERVDFGDERRIEWRYTADGTKLKKEVYDGGTKVFTQHYINGYVYRDSTLEFFSFDEGRVRYYNGSLRYEYDLTDHLGNVRATFTSENGLPKLLQRDDYYPFGLRFNSTVNGPENKFTYNGKELEDEHGLNWYHYGVRFYDPQLGRWHAVDPMDEFMSPYSYVGADPINRLDPDGAASLFDDIYYNSETNSTHIVRTDEPDQLWVDGEFAGGTDVSFWEDGAKIYDNYAGLFMSNLGDRLLNDNYWGRLFNNAPRPEIREGLFRARTAFGSRQSGITMLKVTGFGAGMAAGMLTGGGALLGSSGLVTAGASLSTGSSILSTSESLAKGKYGVALGKVGLAVVTYGAYEGIKQSVVLASTERAVANGMTHTVEYIGNTVITATDNMK